MLLRNTEESNFFSTVVSRRLPMSERGFESWRIDVRSVGKSSVSSSSLVPNISASSCDGLPPAGADQSEHHRAGHTLDSL